jgi:ACS family tartrate transporter-like MFS transporter
MEGRIDNAAVGRAVTKASWRIFPLLGLGYLIAYMDRVNISFAAIQMNVDLKFSATVYGLGAGMFFLSYSLFEIPSNLLLIRFGARRWIARIMITWGLLATMMMFVRSPMQFYVLRFLVGLAEAGFFPGVIYYLAHWYPHVRRGRAISLFYLFNPLGVAVMGVISVGLLALDGHASLRGWQWLFLVEGFPAVLIGLAILRFLPDAPATVGWLSEREKELLTGGLARDHELTGDAPHGHVLASLRDPLVLWLALIDLFTIGAGQTFMLSAPVLIKATAGLSTPAIGYLVSLAGVLGALSMLAAGWFADHYRDRFAPLLVALMCETLGLLVIALAPSPHAVTVAFLVFFAGYSAASSALIVICGDVFNVRVLGVCLAAINTVLQFGNFAGPAVFGAARDATGSYQAGLWTMPLVPLLAFVLTFMLMRKLSCRTVGIDSSPEEIVS